MSFSTELTLFLTNKAMEEHFVKSAAKIALHNFDWRLITFVFFNTTLLCGEEVFAKFYNKGIILSQSEYDTPYAQTTKQHVLFGIDNKNIEFILNWMQKRVFDNTGKHIVICLSENIVDCNESEAIRIFWHYKVTNVVFVRRAYNQRGLVGYTYFPLEDSLCDMGSPVKLNLDACFDITRKDNCNMFPKKLINFHGCSLIISAFEYPPNMYMENMSRPVGVIGDMVYLLGERLNANIKIRTPRKSNGWGVRLPDGTWVGSLGDVYHDFANISFGVVTLDRFKYFDVSGSYNTARIVWVTSPTQFEPSSLKLLRPFCKYTHIAVATIYALVIASALLTKTRFWYEFSTKINMNHWRSSVVFYSWMLFMGLPTNVMPKKRTLLVIVYIWIWYTFLIRTIYQASLINSLKNNVYLPNHDTLEKAIDAGFRILGNIELKEYYSDSPAIYNKWETLNASDVNDIAKKISEGCNFVTPLTLDKVTLFRRNFKNHNLYILPQMVAVTPTVTLFKKFSPLMEPINHVQQQLIQTGFVKKFNNDYLANIPGGKDANTNEPITLEHLKGCFIILFTGWIVSFVVFICETIFAKWMQIN